MGRHNHHNRIFYDPLTKAAANTIWATGSNANIRAFSSGTWHNTKIEQPDHMLVITNAVEDVGQDDYFEELEWEVLHSIDCPRQIVDLGDGGFNPSLMTTHYHPISPQVEYQCPMGQEVLHAGLDSLNVPWQDLEPGRYPIEQWGHYDQRTNDYDGGIRLV